MGNLKLSPRKKPKNNSPSQGEVKKNSRSKFTEIFGPSMEMNAHEDTRIRLMKVAEMLERQDFGKLERGLGAIYRKTVNDLINIFYIDNVFEPKTESSQKLLDLYKENFNLRVTQGFTRQQRIKILQEKHTNPALLSNGQSEPTEEKWKVSELKMLDDYRWVAITLEELNKTKKSKRKTSKKM
ncbi:hypothetical protein H5A35_03275 [Pectobacterium brasiliense]|uniref:hypothetical protein n=1 Tax=Pectobacterium brasiliense TaxID=180957 RepID=UPI001968CFF9|nr:hypothetical protein [Pectobacterium brasiliense]MBN3206431.1 hypothetical protein [Pectobacterium brasiliense]